ncbi:MAG: motility protein A [Lachnospiraceae bacterium]|nr:motility protein A [Lachnospiraceae bacterium]
MDIASIIGLIFGFVLMIFGIISGGASVMDYIDVPSILITFGGSVCGVLASYDVASFVNGFKSFTLTFKMPAINIEGTIRSIIDLSNIARKEGLLSLEEAAAELEDPFMKKGILLIVDGTDPDLVRAILETEIMSVDSRHRDVIGFWECWGALGPAWGMIGTLIGLVAMLNDMSDPSAIGPAMAVALITTFYGSMIANWICTPTANKLKMNNANEMQLKEVMVEGLLSIQAGENPRVIEEKLKSFLPPASRSIGSEGDDMGGAEE